MDDLIITKDHRREFGNPPCYRCIHVRSLRSYTCDAFTGEIPIEIWSGRNDHTMPFPGDHGIQFELRTQENFRQKYGDAFLKELEEELNQDKQRYLSSPPSLPDDQDSEQYEAIHRDNAHSEDRAFEELIDGLIEQFEEAHQCVGIFDEQTDRAFEEWVKKTHPEHYAAVINLRNRLRAEAERGKQAQ